MEEVKIRSEPTLGSKVDRLTELIESGGASTKYKSKKFKMPFSGRVGKSGTKRGFITIVEIAENGGVAFTREQIIDGTVKLKDTFHAIDEKDCLSYNNKPLLIIPKKSKEPYNPNYVKNDTFSQKHIMSRMMNETIGTGKKIGMLGMSIGAIILGGVLIYALIAG